MRNPERIDRIIRKFTYLWKSYPDWRMAQLYVNLFGTGDTFYLEDDLLEKRLDDIIANGF